MQSRPTVRYAAIASAIAFTVLTTHCGPAIRQPPVTASSQTSAPGQLGRSIEEIAQLLVTRLRPEAGTRPRLAIADLTDAGGAECSLGAAVSERLMTRLFLAERFDFIERSQLHRVLQEQQIATTDLVNPDSAARIGRMLGATAIVTGTLRAAGDHFQANVRIVQVETGAVVSVAEGSIPRDTEVASLGVCGAESGSGGASPSGRAVRIRLANDDSHDHSYEVSLQTSQGVLRCPGEVNYLAPCVIPGVPDGPARLTVTGSNAFVEDLTIGENNRALTIRTQRGHLGPGLGVVIAVPVLGATFASIGMMACLSPNPGVACIASGTVYGLAGAGLIAGILILTVGNEHWVEAEARRSAGMRIELRGIGAAPLPGGGAAVGATITF